ncbi:hypothetical protein Nepgr_009685 [Nepenthes gracilis]|uniref:Uncharacterized protein n=1 Tax=Nepenthes gracilis TaxID=150966 RepID=A0AAD3XKK8_NEPGR|nr:hypothetical protein Nepgr_009685 [Nepenthes gracilis]
MQYIYFSWFVVIPLMIPQPISAKGPLSYKGTLSSCVAVELLVLFEMGDEYKDKEPLSEKAYCEKCPGCKVKRVKETQQVCL